MIGIVAAKETFEMVNDVNEDYDVWLEPLSRPGTNVVPKHPTTPRDESPAALALFLRSGDTWIDKRIM
ncbi:hypothetical protein Y032_0094g2725 [Ancylostoma ceylanicum]|uniref:Uncharacterized protein n=1 Tax=Ancylostoma ceylanicum TaxID=53326 RepID=A0A016TL53_9BILA|nr:hypothetical protein Y032_0094g2725 [Ancylostoma ceylanicum]